jgi:hypothetical protein
MYFISCLQRYDRKYSERKGKGIFKDSETPPIKR